MRGYYRDATVGVLVGNPEIQGRFFYNDDMTGFNYQRAMMKLDAVLDTVGKLQGVANPPAVYVGSTTIDTCLPGFRQQNDLGFGEFDPLASIWLGNRTRIAAHYDVPDNIACVAVGHRRFILFPPAELANLYVGPLDFTPAGQAISLVDFAQPDLRAVPALRGRVAECAQSRNSNPAMRSSSRACGGTTSRRWTISTCWSITGGARPPITWVRRSMR